MRFFRRLLLGLILAAQAHGQILGPGFFGVGNFGAAGFFRLPGAAFSNQKSPLFDGVDEYVDIANAAARDFTGGTALTISFWWKGNPIVAGYILSNYDLTRHFGIAILADETAEFVLNDTTGDKVWVGNVAGSTTTWNHTLMTMDGTKTMAGSRIWMNGVEATLTNTLGGTSFAGTVNTGAGYYMGRLRSVAAVFFAGNIDELAFYSTAINDPTFFRTAGGGSKQIPTANRVGYFRNGDATDAFPTIFDQDGLANGTMVNMEAGDIVSDAP
jgi:hypothetical protein